MKDRKKGGFMALEQDNMTVDASETKFHALSHYATVGEKWWGEHSFFVKSLNHELQVMFVHMNFVGKGFNEVTNFVKKMDGV